MYVPTILVVDDEPANLTIMREILQKTYVLRRILNPMGTTDAIEFLISKLKQTKSNSEFFESMNA